MKHTLETKLFQAIIKNLKTLATITALTTALTLGMGTQNVIAYGHPKDAPRYIELSYNHGEDKRIFTAWSYAMEDKEYDIAIGKLRLDPTNNDMREGFKLDPSTPNISTAYHQLSCDLFKKLINSRYNRNLISKGEDMREDYKTLIEGIPNQNMKEYATGLQLQTTKWELDPKWKKYQQIPKISSKEIEKHFLNSMFLTVGIPLEKVSWIMSPQRTRLCPYSAVNS